MEQQEIGPLELGLAGREETLADLRRVLKQEEGVERGSFLQSVKSRAATTAVSTPAFEHLASLTENSNESIRSAWESDRHLSLGLGTTAVVTPPNASERNLGTYDDDDDEGVEELIALAIASASSSSSSSPGRIMLDNFVIDDDNDENDENKGSYVPSLLLQQDPSAVNLYDDDDDGESEEEEEKQEREEIVISEDEQDEVEEADDDEGKDHFKLLSLARLAPTLPNHTSAESSDNSVVPFSLDLDLDDLENDIS